MLVGRSTSGSADSEEEEEGVRVLKVRRRMKFAEASRGIFHPFLLQG